MATTSRTEPRAALHADLPATAPVGAWAARVHRGTETSEVVLHLTADGRAFLSTGGAGHWDPAGPGSFAFRVAEPLYDERGPAGGACVAWVDIDQLAVLDGDTFHSTGTSVVRDSTTGRVLRTKHVSLRARAAASS